MPRKSDKRRLVEKGVKVAAVTSGRGPSATTVNVELDPQQMKEQIGEFKEVRAVSAEIPEEGGGSLKWKKEPMWKIGEQALDRGGHAGVQKFSSTHYGPSDSHRYGVGVKIETDAGTLSAQKHGESYTVREADKPADSEKIRTPRKRR